MTHGVPNDGSQNPSWFNVGHGTPDEYRKKNSEYHKNVRYSKETNLKRSLANKGKPKSPKHIAKLSGQNHWNWQGGKSANREDRRSDEYNEWRKAVHKRDHYTCKDCSHRFKGIVAHHLKLFAAFPKFRYVVENGVTLCRSCHLKRHKEIGVATRFPVNSKNCINV